MQPSLAGTPSTTTSSGVRSQPLPMPTWTATPRRILMLIGFNCWAVLQHTRISFRLFHRQRLGCSGARALFRRPNVVPYRLRKSARGLAILLEFFGGCSRSERCPRLCRHPLSEFVFGWQCSWIQCSTLCPATLDATRIRGAKRMKKREWSILLVLAASLAFSGCGGAGASSSVLPLKE